MKTTTSQTLFSQEFGALYSDITTKQLRHQFPIMARFENEEQESLCVFDMAADDILKWNLLYQDIEDWTVKIPTTSVRFIEDGTVVHENQPRPLYRIEAA